MLLGELLRTVDLTKLVEPRVTHTSVTVCFAISLRARTHLRTHADAYMHTRERRYVSVVLVYCSSGRITYMVLRSVGSLVLP